MPGALAYFLNQFDKGLCVGGGGEEERLCWETGTQSYEARALRVST